MHRGPWCVLRLLGQFTSGGLYAYENSVTTHMLFNWILIGIAQPPKDEIHSAAVGMYKPERGGFYPPHPNQQIIPRSGFPPHFPKGLQGVGVCHGKHASLNS